MIFSALLAERKMVGVVSKLFSPVDINLTFVSPEKRLRKRQESESQASNDNLEVIEVNSDRRRIQRVVNPREIQNFLWRMRIILEFSDVVNWNTSIKVVTIFTRNKTILL